MSTNHVKPVVASLAASVLLLAGCSSESEPSAEVTPVAQADTAAPPASDAAADAAAPSKQLVKDGAPAASTDPNVRSLGGPDAGKPPTPSQPVSAEFVVVAEPARLDLGEIPTGETKTGTITLRNIGDRPMTIGKTKTSCGCTTAQLEAGKILNAGADIDVEIRMKGGQVARVLNKTVTFNIEGQPPLVVPVRCEAIAYVTVEPTRMHPERQPDGRFTLTSKDGEPFRVISMVPPMIEAFPEEASSTVELSLPWEKFLEIGQRRKLILYTDHPKCQQVYMDIDLSNTEYASAPPARTPNTEVRGLDKGRTAGDPLTTGRYGDLIAAGKGEMILEKVAAGELPVDSRDSSGATLLGLAAKTGNVDMVTALLDAGADIEAADRAGRTPLMSASESKNAEVIDVLLEAGSSLTARDNIGGTALSWAAAFGNRDCVEVLIDAGARVDVVGTATGYTPLMWAAGFGDPSSIEPIIEAGAQLETTDLLEGLTPLMHASRTGKVEGIRLLVKHGAELESTDRVGRTAFLTASAESGGTVEKLQALVEAGADIRAKDKRGQGALDLAGRRTDLRSREVVEYLESILGGETEAAGAEE
ncbi:MAG: ankyrin repeat domain-containing protein [Planctomycetota bacterium]|jgi:ankyrin repeat protein